MVNHVYICGDGRVCKYMHCHVYHQGVGKKGANNVASLIVKILLQQDLVIGKLKIISDNCSGQSKNNAVFKLVAWHKATGYFKTVNFIFVLLVILKMQLAIF